MNITQDTILSDKLEAEELFAKELWLDHVDSEISMVGEIPFISFLVTKDAPVYLQALQRVQLSLDDGNCFKGRIQTAKREGKVKFPESIESSVLEGIIGRTSRVISENDTALQNFGFVPFHNREETKIIQPANHLILGRRGVGKSTLITKAVEVLRRRKNICVVVDLQAFANRNDVRVASDLFASLLTQVRAELERLKFEKSDILQKLKELISSSQSEKAKIPQLVLDIKATIKQITTSLRTELFVFLDDLHLLPAEIQPSIISTLHGALKGAHGWLKIAGLPTLVRYYDQLTKTGLQVPGDAQIISLDLTLTDPLAAEKHLRSILENYLKQVGVKTLSSVIEDASFKRLVWANAGVVRDFLQMFASALGSARKSNRAKVVLSDVNLSIGELGKQKISDLEQDSRNHADELKVFLEKLEEFCLNEHKINSFLLKEEVSDFSKTVKTLSDLRVIHLVHPSITPHAAGERFEAYMLDYSLFVGFRRKRNIKEIRPKHGLQFQVKELRSLPVFRDH